MRKNKRLIGIYLIYCVNNKRSYVGSASFSIRQRWGRHINDLNKNKHCNPHLQRSWNKYGKNNFRFFILEECNPEDCLGLETGEIYHTAVEASEAHRVCKSAIQKACKGKHKTCAGYTWKYMMQ